MKYYAIGDLHLSHSVDKPMAVFGTHWEKHAEKIKAAWLEQVTVDDVILIPGDISWGTRLHEASSDLAWLEALPGDKVCIRGNHDYWWDRPNKLNQGYKTITFLQNKAYMVGERAICGTRGWLDLTHLTPSETDEKMVARELIRLKLSLEDAIAQGAKEIWVMLHYPPCLKQTMQSPFVALMAQYPVTKVIYGHLHDETSWGLAPQGVYQGVSYHLVAADYLGFKPTCLTDYEQ